MFDPTGLQTVDGGFLEIHGDSSPVPRGHLLTGMSSCIATGFGADHRDHAFIQNLRRGHCELAVDATPLFRLATAFDGLRPAI